MTFSPTRFTGVSGVGSGGGPSTATTATGPASSPYATTETYAASTPSRRSRPAARALTVPRPTPAWWRDTVGAATILSLAIVVGFWISSDAVHEFTNPAGATRALGRLAALISSDLLLIQVLLMARIPLAEKAYGQDELAIRHRSVGFASFALMVAHIVLTTLGWANLNYPTVINEFVRITLHEPGMLLALAGTGALVMVVITSIRKARAKLRYESWQLLHLYAYLGVGLALPHQLWAGSSFTSNRFATVYWWTLWAAAAGSVLVYRVGLPAWRSYRHQLRVAQVRPEQAGAGRHVFTVVMTGRDLHRMPVLPGQFFQFRFLDGPGWSRAHPFSMSAAPNGHSLEITVDTVGDGTQRMSRLAPGTKVVIEGPYGKLHPGVRTRDKVTLMASGIGISPMKSLLEGFTDRDATWGRPSEVTLIYRLSDPGQGPLLQRIRDLCHERSARLLVVGGHRVTDRPSWLPQEAAHLSDFDALRHLVPDIAEHDVYVCGGEGWMAALELALDEAGVPGSQIHIERFTY